MSKRGENPVGTITSCNRATIAMKPYFHEEIGSETFLKAKVIKMTMQNMTIKREISDFVAASLPRTGPTELNLFTSTFLESLNEKDS